jgi:hypothetical protein
MLALVYCLSGLLLSLPLAAEPPPIRVPKPQPDSLVAQSYYLQLLRLVLHSGADGRAVPAIQEVTLMEQGRATTELRRGQLIDVYWMGTSNQREQSLHAIPIPLDRGLLGFRRLIIRADSISVFAEIEAPDDLKKLTACQGLDWPDVEILRASNFRVIEASGFEGMYKQLVGGRCDYLPRGLFEAMPELEQRKERYPTLMIFDGVLIHYPFTVYFFVNPKNEQLAQWITKGLERMIDSGEFQRFMVTHPLMNHLFPLEEKVRPALIFDIPNPLLPQNTDYKNARYWIQREQLMETYDQPPR